MSILLLDEMIPGTIFPQSITIERDTDIHHIRPWVYIQGVLVDGDFVCRIKDGATVIATSTISYIDINAIGPDAYKHGKLQFDFEPAMLHIPQAGTTKEYQLEFEMTNHTLDLNNFIGIVRDWEDPVWIDPNAIPNSAVAPCGLEIYNFKEKL